MLSAVPGLEADNLLVLFSLIDRWDGDSRWAPFWRALPALFQTGLSFPPRLVAALEGTAAELELRRGQAHLRAQFAATRPLMDALLAAYPQHLRPEWFSYEAYVWAAELWYSYAFEVRAASMPNEPVV
jgi:histone-lysine N-methyltransferase SETD3